MLLKTLFLLPNLLCNVEFELVHLILQHQTIFKDFDDQNSDAAWISK